MQPQKLSLPCYTFFAPSFSSSLRTFTYYPPTHGPTKLVFSRNSKFGSCNSLKWVSKSPTSLRNNGCLVRVRCGVVHGDNDDGFYMRRCVELARKAIGCTSPNPMVGCVIVKDRKIVGEGFHPKAGQPHAEATRIVL